MNTTLFTADIEIAHRRADLLDTARAANAGRSRRRRRGADSDGRDGTGTTGRRGRADDRPVPHPRDTSDDRPEVAVPA